MSVRDDGKGKLVHEDVVDHSTLCEDARERPYQEFIFTKHLSSVEVHREPGQAFPIKAPLQDGVLGPRWQSLDMVPEGLACTSI